MHFCKNDNSFAVADPSSFGDLSVNNWSWTQTAPPPPPLTTPYLKTASILTSTTMRHTTLTNSDTVCLICLLMLEYWISTSPVTGLPLRVPWNWGRWISWVSLSRPRVPHSQARAALLLREGWSVTRYYEVLLLVLLRATFTKKLLLYCTTFNMRLLLY